MIKLAKNVAQSKNYVADDSTFPQQVCFANGRTVQITFYNGRPFLVIGLIELEEDK